MRRIPKKALHRPLQGGYYIVPNAKPRQAGIGGSYQAALDRANRANEQRYRQILSGYDQLHSRVMGDLGKVGGAERADIDREYRNAASQVYGNLVNRGFANSSLRSTMQQGVTREKLAAIGRMNDRLLQQRSAYDTNITQGKLGVMERRYDNAPDPNQMIALAQAMGRSGYGQRPIGVQPGAYANAYNQALSQFFGNMFYGRGGVPQRQKAGGYWNRLPRKKKAAAAKPEVLPPPLNAVFGNQMMLDRVQGLV